MDISPPSLPKRSRRVEDIVSIAREMTEEVGWDALTMRGLAERVGIKAPSLYKHTANKDELRALLTVDALLNVGYSLWATQHADGSFKLEDLMMTFRDAALAHPEMYKLVINGSSSCSTLQVEPWRSLLVETSSWLNTPLASIAPNKAIAYSVWSSTYGLVSLEVNDSLPDRATAEVAWQTMVHVYEPHFAAAKKLRDSGISAEIDTTSQPIVINPVAVPADSVGDRSARNVINGLSVPDYSMPFF